MGLYDSNDLEQCQAEAQLPKPQQSPHHPQKGRVGGPHTGLTGFEDLQKNKGDPCQSMPEKS